MNLNLNSKKSEPPLRILGIDPGLNITGYGVLEIVDKQHRLVEAGVVRGRARGTLAERVHDIHTGVTDVIRALKPHVMALEKLYSHYDRPTTAILMGHARGAICLAAAQGELEVADYAATQVKSILTGSGRASKSLVQLAIQYGLNVPSWPDPPGVADALASAMCDYYLAHGPAGKLRKVQSLKSRVQS